MGFCVYVNTNFEVFLQAINFTTCQKFVKSEMNQLTRIVAAAVTRRETIATVMSSTFQACNTVTMIKTVPTSFCAFVDCPHTTMKISVTSSAYI